MTLVAHWSNQQCTEVILTHCLMSTTHTQVLLKVRELPQGTDQPSLLFEVDTEALIHRVKLVTKL